MLMTEVSLHGVVVSVWCVVGAFKIYIYTHIHTHNRKDVYAVEIIIAKHSTNNSYCICTIFLRL